MPCNVELSFDISQIFLTLPYIRLRPGRDASGQSRNQLIAYLDTLFTLYR